MAKSPLCLAANVETSCLKAYLILAAKQCGHLQMVFDEKDRWQNLVSFPLQQWYRYN